MRRVLAGWLWLAGCFADAPDVAEGGSTTGPPPCPVGSSGCPCTGGGSCDAPLECHTQSQLCFDPQCDLGAAQCPCSDGSCFSGLLCIDGFCQPEPASETGAMETTPGETTTTPGESTSTGLASTTIEPQDTGTTGQSETDPTLAEDSTTGMPQTCLECLDEVVYDQCVEQGEACFDDGDCFAILGCALTGDTPIMDCCATAAAETLAWNALVECAQIVCVPSCSMETFCIFG